MFTKGGEATRCSCLAGSRLHTSQHVPTATAVEHTRGFVRAKQWRADRLLSVDGHGALESLDRFLPSYHPPLERIRYIVAEDVV